MTTMYTISDDAIEFIKKHEGVEAKVYLDAVGKPTAGVGHLLTEEEWKSFKVGQPVTEQQIHDWLKADLAKVQDCINAIKAQIGRAHV